MDEDSPREQTAPPPDRRTSARVPIMLAVSGVVLATALGTVAMVTAAPKTTSGQPNNQRVQVNPYTGQTVGTSSTPTTDTTSQAGSPTPNTTTSTTSPTTTRRMIVTTTSGPHGYTTVTIPETTVPPTKPTTEPPTTTPPSTTTPPTTTPPPPTTTPSPTTTPQSPRPGQ